MQQPIILITNDDSIDAKGLRYLVDRVSHLGKSMWWHLPHHIRVSRAHSQ